MDTTSKTESYLYGKISPEIPQSIWITRFCRVFRQNVITPEGKTYPIATKEVMLAREENSARSIEISRFLGNGNGENFVQFYGYYENNSLWASGEYITDDYGESLPVENKLPTLGIVMEYIPCSLAQIIKLRNENLTFFSPEEQGDLVQGLANGLRYMHFVGILHRDIKSDNVLVERYQVDYRDSATRYRPKFCDFGFSEYTWCADKGYYGTLGYIAPEIAGGTAIYNAASDVFALAVVLFEVQTCKKVHCLFKNEESHFYPSTEKPLQAEGFYKRIDEEMHKASLPMIQEGKALVNDSLAFDAASRPNAIALAERALFFKTARMEKPAPARPSFSL